MAGNVTAAAAATAVAPQSTAGITRSADKTTVRVSPAQSPATITIGAGTTPDTKPKNPPKESQLDNNKEAHNDSEASYTAVTSITLITPTGTENKLTFNGSETSTATEINSKQSKPINEQKSPASNISITKDTEKILERPSSINIATKSSPTTVNKTIQSVTRTSKTLPNKTDTFSSKGRVLLTDKVSILGSGPQDSFAEKTLVSQFGLPSIPVKRKFSFPAALHANLLGLSSPNSDITTNASTRRRFSNVGDVVSRKLSNTIGWRTLPVPPQEVVAQGKALCCQYIRNRLKRSGIFNKKLGLYRLRSVVGTPSGMIVTEVYPSLVTAGQELERMHPKVFSNISRQASSSPAGVIVSDKAAANLLLAIGREITKTDITWGKVVGVFAVAGGLAVDCVCQGHPEYLHGLVEGIADLLEEDLAEWIASNGGWTSLAAQCRTPTPEVTASAYLSILGIFITIVFVFYIILKFCFKLYTL